jgi:hypothetical protein
MQCVVPLAGPQLTHPRYGLVPKFPVDGVPLLRRTIETRRWWIDGRLRAADLIFVLREGLELQEIRAAVESWFPGCRTVILSHLTQGAALSALAGSAAVSDLDAPFIIDLADILYDTDADIERCFASDATGAAVTYFEDRDPCYSYFQFGQDGSVIFAAEKNVISNHASAGTYVFRTAGHFIAAAGRSLVESRGELTVGNALFVCPVVNSIVRQGLQVMPLKVRNVRSVSKLLHGDGAAFK